MSCYRVSLSKDPRLEERLDLLDDLRIDLPQQPEVQEALPRGGVGPDAEAAGVLGIRRFPLGGQVEVSDQRDE
eukprot:767359-Hanusia_phi.AAC.10